MIIKKENCKRKILTKKSKKWIIKSYKYKILFNKNHKVKLTIN